MLKTKLTSLALSLCLIFSNAAAFAEGRYITRGEAAELLINASDDYNGVYDASDIIKGRGDGSLHENEPVTRAEFLVMLDRAFGELPTPTGHNARVAIPEDEFTDIPKWAKTELADVFASGIIAGTGGKHFSPDEPITDRQAKLFIERVYSLYGTNPKDDFYASVNKDTLETTELLPGLTIGGTLYELNMKASGQIKKIIEDITSKEHEYGSPEQKLSDMYKCMVGRDDSAGTEPLSKYLDMIGEAVTAADLVKVNSALSEELCFAPLMDFSVVTDMKESTKHAVSFDVPQTSFTKEFYEDGESDQARIFKD